MIKADKVKFPKLPGNCPMRVNEPQDVDKYNDGYGNEDLLRIHEAGPVPFDAPDKSKNHSVPFNPYSKTPQFELAPRDYTFYISDTNSYRLTNIHNHDEESTFWEIP